MAMALAMGQTMLSARMDFPAPSLCCPCIHLQIPRLQAAAVKLSTSRFTRVCAAAAATESEIEGAEASPESGTEASPESGTEQLKEATVAGEDTEAPSLALPQQRIRVKLRAYFGEYIEEASKMIVEAVKNTGAGIMGPVPLPTQRKLFCVLRSPHVDKDSREHFEIRTHKRLIDIKNPNARTIDALMKLDIPVGVDVEVKL